jgi:hypothetical protein
MTVYGLPDPDASGEAFNESGKLYAIARENSAANTLKLIF